MLTCCQHELANCPSWLLPVNPIDVNHSDYLTESDDQQRNRAGEAIEQCQPVVTRRLDEHERRHEGHNTRQT